MTDDEQNESVCIAKEPCPACGSRDNLGRYSDGHGFCFGCKHYEPGDGQSATPTTKRKSALTFDPIRGEVRPLTKRGISEETCRFWGYECGEFKDQKVQIATYRNAEGEAVGQKLRFPNKEFLVNGSLKKAVLYGEHLWRDKGKKIIITEGEIDALSVSHAQDNKWPVVSIPNGASGAKKALAARLEYLSAFEEVILWFDDDEPGVLAAAECATLFKPGQCKIAVAPGYKDANEALLGGGRNLIISTIFGAKTYRPDGIINGADMWDSIASDDAAIVTVLYPWEGLNKILRGARAAELVTLTAGSGIGKSAVIREIAHALVQDGETVGMLMLEESTKRTIKGLMGLQMNQPLHLDLTPWSELSDSDKAIRRAAYEATVGSGRVFLYDHFGSTDVDNLLAKVRYLVNGCGCKWVFLDHLSIVVSGLESGDERKDIDLIMTKLRTLVQETDCGLFLVSHLKRPEGKGHEEGAATSLSQLRGSHSIAQLSDIVIGLERNQQDEETANITTLRVLKNRFTGETGIATHLSYSPTTGRLTEVNLDFATGGASSDSGDDPF